MIDHEDLKKLNYLDEEFSPQQDMDDHDLMLSNAYKELGKVCWMLIGLIIKVRSILGEALVEKTSGHFTEANPWLLQNHITRTVKLFYERHI